MQRKTMQRKTMQMPRNCLTALITAVVFTPSTFIAVGEINAEQQSNSVEIEKLQFEQTHNTIANQYQQLQLLVTGVGKQGRTRDLTHAVQYEANPAGKVAVSATGSVTPLESGTVTITAKAANNKTAKIDVTVHELKDMTPGFYHHVMPVLSKYHCNHCHGKPSGQGGFKLSLFGSNPPADYEAITQAAYGRRINRLEPESSLILRKATLGIPHGGGRRFKADTTAYEIVSDWVKGGAQVGARADVKVKNIEVTPQQRILTPMGRQQLNVIAHFSDGSKEDVTHLAAYKADENMLVEVDEAGYVKTNDQRGEFTVVILYQGQVGTFTGTIPFDFPAESYPAPRNEIDTAVFAKLKKLGIPPSQLCSDETFLRRVTIDLAGRLPTLDETKTFLADSSPEKRDRCIERLLNSSDYADYFASKWIHLLQNSRSAPEHRRGSFAFHRWIRESFRNNKPYDQFVREILTSAGDYTQTPPTTWYREVSSIENQVENMSQLFLGVRITCARCHHHPYEKWTQKDYYQLSAFFSRVKRKVSVDGNPKYFEERIYHDRGPATVKHPDTGEVLKPAGLAGPALEIDPDSDPRHKLVDWMVAEDNPFFSTVFVNRTWKHFLGRGIIDPEDDIRETNPPSNPELLAVLKNRFINSKYDIKDLLRLICQSTTYQLSSQANQYNLEDDQFYSRFQPRRLNAEVVLDSIDRLLKSETRFRRLPLGMRAVQLPDAAKNDNIELLKLFGRPEAQSACECERSQDGDLRQSLYLLTSSDILGKLSSSKGRAAEYAKNKQYTNEQLVSDIYLRSLSRLPREQELQIAVAHLEKTTDRKTAVENILWAVMNTKEFLYNH